MLISMCQIELKTSFFFQTFLIKVFHFGHNIADCLASSFARVCSIKCEISCLRRHTLYGGGGAHFPLQREWDRIGINEIYLANAANEHYTFFNNTGKIFVRSSFKLY